MGTSSPDWWEDFDEFLRIEDSIEPKRDSRVVNTGDIITAAEVSAGIDMAHHLIVRLPSEDRARVIKRRLQYVPGPPV